LNAFFLLIPKVAVFGLSCPSKGDQYSIEPFLNVRLKQIECNNPGKSHSADFEVKGYILAAFRPIAFEQLVS